MVRWVLLALAAACCLGAFFLKPLWGAIDPGLRVYSELRAQEDYLGREPTPEEGLDPWGQPWGFVSDGCFGGGPYSVGPNGVNDMGKGDDIYPQAQAARGFRGATLLGYQWSREIALLLGLWLAALSVSVEYLRRHASKQLLPECFYAALIALPALPICGAFAVWLTDQPGQLLELAPSLVVPPGLAVGGTAALITWLAALYLRTRAGSRTGAASEPTPQVAPRRLKLAVAGLLLLILLGETAALGVERYVLAQSADPHGLETNFKDTGALGFGSTSVFQMQCASCHPIEGEAWGLGLPVKGLFGSMVELESGESVLADEEFIRRSIVDPSAQITKGHQDAMIRGFAQSLRPNEIGWLVEFYKSYGAESQETTNDPRTEHPQDAPRGR